MAQGLTLEFFETLWRVEAELGTSQVPSSADLAQPLDDQQRLEKTCTWARALGPLAARQMGWTNIDLKRQFHVPATWWPPRLAYDSEEPVISGWRIMEQELVHSGSATARRVGARIGGTATEGIWLDNEGQLRGFAVNGTPYSATVYDAPVITPDREFGLSPNQEEADILHGYMGKPAEPGRALETAFFTFVALHRRALGV